MPKTKEKTEAPEQIAASPAMDNMKAETPEKAAGPQQTGGMALATNMMGAAGLTPNGADGASMVNMLQRSVGNARISRMLGGGGDAPSVDAQGESAGATAPVQRKCGCGGDPGAGKECAECQAKSDLVQATPVDGGPASVSASPASELIPSSMPTPDKSKQDAAGVESGKPVRASTGGTVRTSRIQRWSWRDVVAEGVGTVVGIAGGPAVEAATRILVMRKIASLEGKLARIKAAMNRRGGLHFSDAQWMLIMGLAGSLESMLPGGLPILTSALQTMRSGTGIIVVASVIALPVVIAALIAALEAVLIIMAAIIIAFVLFAIIEKIIDALEEAARNTTICDALLVQCLNNPWQPDWNKGDFGPRKDCGACYRECKHAGGVWPYYKCPG